MHYVTHAAPTVSEGRYRGMADAASYADCRELATPQISPAARANEHVAASKPRGGDKASCITKKQRKYYEHLTGQADVAWD